MSNIKIGILVGILLVVPVFVNFIVLVPCPFGNNWVASFNSPWIGFFGAYIGSSISSITSFIILYKTIKENRGLQKRELEDRELNAIRHDLAERFAQFRPSDILPIRPYDKLSNDEINIEITRIQKLRDKYLTLYCSASIMYDTGKPYDMNFLRAYYDLLNKSTNLIEQIMATFIAIKHKGWNEINTHFFVVLSNEVSKLMEDDRKVLDLAKKCISARMNKI